MPVFLRPKSPPKGAAFYNKWPPSLLNKKWKEHHLYKVLWTKPRSVLQLFCPLANDNKSVIRLQSNCYGALETLVFLLSKESNNMDIDRQ